MNATNVLHMLGRFFGLFSIPSLLCAVWAFSNDRYQQASLFILVVTVSAVLGAVFLVSSSSKNLHKAGLKEIVAFLTAVWGGMSVLGALPFLMLTQSDPISALLESVSCLTTTGTSLVPPDTVLPASIIAWRGILHITGAMLAISGTLLLVATQSSVGQGLRRLQAIGIWTRLNFASFMKIFLISGAVLLALFLLCFNTLLFEGLPLRDAFALAVGAITTGQVFPYDASILNGTMFSGTVICVTLFFASINLANILMLIRAPQRARIDIETIGILAGMLLLFVLIYAAHPQLGSLASAVHAFSIVSTSGLLLSPDDAHLLGWPVIIFFGFVGGATASSTGGMKFFRFRLLAARALHEFSRLAQPKAIQNFRFSGMRNPVEAMLSVWVYLIGFACVTVMIAGYLALTGMSFEASISTAVGAITNSAALFHVENMNLTPNPVTKLILTFSMLFGRLELLLLFSLIIRN
ncbi:potassium transporter TrkG [Ponticaulis profundi]|uniref:Potassium transporter TrkG n=1 Tax=Ponticaulis profundi TaxID=2665222 RepID=A0ABW1SE96_9PROT